MKNGKENKNPQVVVVGTSSGGLQALTILLQGLPLDFPLPILAVQHLGNRADDFLPRYLDENCALRVEEARERERARPGHVYIAPADYHLLIEDDFTLSLSSTERVNYARPAIDVLFESAAFAFGPRVVGVVLTGANSDGARGLETIKAYGGIALVQDPVSAEVDIMPRAAIKAAAVDFTLPLEGMASALIKLCIRIDPGGSG